MAIDTDSKKSIEKEFWKALDHSPILMVRLDDRNEHALPMTAQLDADAHGTIWFYTARDNRLSDGGSTMAQFASKGHDVFACMAGTLSQEQDRAVIDKHWSNMVEAWYPGGREDPNLVMLRFDIRNIEIWVADIGITGLFKMAVGSHIDPDEAGKHAEITY